MRRLLTLLTAPFVGLALALFGGPVISGAFFLPMGIGHGPALELRPHPGIATQEVNLNEMDW